MGDDAVDRSRRLGRVAHAPRVGEQRLDDDRLLRPGAGGAAGVRPRGAARAAAVRAAAAGGARRHGRAGDDLPAFQPRQLVRVGLGDCDVDRHCLRARPARARGAALSRSPARVLAHGRRRRRPGRARRHRHRLHRDAPTRAAGRGRRVVCRSPRRAQHQLPAGPCLHGARGGRMGGAARVRGGAGRARSRDGPAGLRLPGAAVEPRTRHRALPRVPRAADRRARSRGPRGAPVGDVGERAAAAACFIPGGAM